MFPLSDTEGCGVNNGPKAYKQVIVKKYNGKITEKQAKPVRMASGEAVGAISGSGEGNAPSAKTVELLLENLNNPQQYTAAILTEFSWLKNDHAFLHAL